MYVTHFPCLNCCKAIIQAGIRAIYYAKDYKNHQFALEQFQEAGVHVEQVELEEMILDTNNHEKLAFTAKLLSKLEEEGASSEEIASFKDEANRLFTATP